VLNGSRRSARKRVLALLITSRKMYGVTRKEMGQEEQTFMESNFDVNLWMNLLNMDCFVVVFFLIMISELQFFANFKRKKRKK
jgi:hypothetical protein